MSLPKGDPVEVSESDPSGEWLKVTAKWCIAGCKETYSGWLRRSNVAYFKEFKLLGSWHSETEFEVQAGDYVERFKVRDNGTFKTYKEQGAMYFFRDIVWARLKKSPSDTEFIFIPIDAGKYCWASDPHEGKFEDKRWNCFSSPFK